MKQLEGTSLLVTVAVCLPKFTEEYYLTPLAQEDLSKEPVLKVWVLDKTEKKTGKPICQSTLSINNGHKQFPVSVNPYGSGRVVCG